MFPLFFSSSEQAESVRLRADLQRWVYIHTCVKLSLTLSIVTVHYYGMCIMFSLFFSFREQAEIARLQGDLQRWVHLYIARIMLSVWLCCHCHYQHCRSTYVCVCKPSLTLSIVSVWYVCNHFPCSFPPEIRQNWEEWGERIAGEVIYMMCYFTCYVLSSC